MEKGWICLHRRFLDWEWYEDMAVRIFFIHCLLRANHTTNKWRGYVIKAGQFISSLNHLAKETGLTERQIRTCIKKLKSTGDIDTQTTNRNTMIIIKNWNKWQTERQSKRQTSDKQVTTNNNDNNIDTNSYINISSSSIELTKEDEELLKSHSKRNKIKYFKPWLRKILENGDYKELLEKEKRLQAKEEKQKKEVEVIEEVETPEDREKIKQIQEQIKQRSKRR